MSYDLIFVPKAEDQTWDDALEAVEEAAEEDDGDGPPSAEVWGRVLLAAGKVLGEVSVFAGASNYEMDHQPTGIQVSYYAQEAAITVPYWYRGDDARAIVETIYRLGQVVQAETGLPGYDPQVELPLAEAAAQPQLAVECFNHVAASFAERGYLSPSGD